MERQTFFYDNKITRMFATVSILWAAVGLIVVLAAVSLALGHATSKEYADLQWPIDILIVLVCVTFGWNMFATIAKRRARHNYVSIWFYFSTVLIIAALNIVNSLEIPYSFWDSYSIYAGIQDAMIQWWYGHNAVVFFLTTPVSAGIIITYKLNK